MSDTPDVKKSRLGLAALAVAAAATLALLAAFATALHAVSAGNQTRPILAAIGTMMVGGGLLELVALALGITALRARGGPHRLAAVATGIAGVALVMLLAILVTGLMGRH